MEKKFSNMSRDERVSILEDWFKLGFLAVKIKPFDPSKEVEPENETSIEPWQAYFIQGMIDGHKQINHGK